jgi:uncharacterized protein YbjT (DUF2867 family)
VPVLVTAAEQPLARQIAIRLVQEGGEVRAFSAGDTSLLRATGVFVASGTRDDEGRLEAAAADVHTMVHVGGGLLSRDPAAMIDDAEVVLRAASNAGVQRLITLSLPGADPRADDAIRRAKGEVEALLAAAALPTVVLRTSLLDTRAIRDALATSGLGPQARDAVVAPVRVEDLIELVVAFDRARSSASTGHLVVAADGPVRRTVAEHLDLAGAQAPGGGSLVGRKLSAAWLTVQLQQALAGPWWTDDPVVLDGWAFAAITPTVPGLPGPA